MNISHVAKAVGLSTDTIRFYEKQGLIEAPPRQSNGYRDYTEHHVSALRFIRTAQSLGFSLAEIGAIGAPLMKGGLERGDIEARLKAKMAQIDAHMAALRRLRCDLTTTLASLRCTPHRPVEVTQLINSLPKGRHEDHP